MAEVFGFYPDEFDRREGLDDPESFIGGTGIDNDDLDGEWGLCFLVEDSVEALSDIIFFVFSRDDDGDVDVGIVAAATTVSCCFFHGEI